MNKAIALSAVLAGLLVSVPANAYADTEQTYDFTGFNEIDVAAGIEVIYEQADAYNVVADFRRGGPDDLKIHKEGDRLYISKKMQAGWGDKLRVTVHVTSPDLNGVEASSGSSIRATGIKSDDFALKVSSGASADLSGECGGITIRVSSGGNADAKALKCETVTATASSGGSAKAYASASAKSKTSSGGSVDIWGDPAAREANNSISGGSTDFH